MSPLLENLAAKCVAETQNSNGEFVQYFDKEMFARLIAKECASLCEINGDTYHYSFTPMKAKVAKTASEHCAKLIENHFNIKD